MKLAEIAKLTVEDESIFDSMAGCNLLSVIQEQVAREPCILKKDKGRGKERKIHGKTLYR